MARFCPGPVQTFTGANGARRGRRGRRLARASLPALSPVSRPELPASLANIRRTGPTSVEKPGRQNLFFPVLKGGFFRKTKERKVSPSQAIPSVSIQRRAVGGGGEGRRGGEAGRTQEPRLAEPRSPGWPNRLETRVRFEVLATCQRSGWTPTGPCTPSFEGEAPSF